MKLFAITSAAVLLGCAGLASGAFAQTPAQVQNAPVVVPQQRTITGDQGTIIIRGPFYTASSQMGDMKLLTPAPLQNDSVYVDGTYIGVTGNIGDIQMAAGAHDLMLCAPDGTPVYRHNVTVASNETTEVSPLQAMNNGVSGVNVPYAVTPNSPSAAYVPPAPPANVAPASVPQPQPEEQGNLRLTTSYAMRNDAVFIDGTYVGQAKLMRDLALTTGTHDIALCAPNGVTDFETSVGISSNHTTHLRATLERPTLNG